MLGSEQSRAFWDVVYDLDRRKFLSVQLQFKYVEPIIVTDDVVKLFCFHAFLEVYFSIDYPFYVD